MKIIVIDIETYYSQTYSLTKLTTEEYIRSPEFETIGVAVQVDSGKPKWFSGTKGQIKKFLDSFDMHENMVVAHNAMFDMAILNWHFDIRPKAIIDTLSMARAIHGTEVGGSLAKLAEHYGAGVKGTEVVNALGKRRIDFDEESLIRYGEYCVNDVSLTYDIFSKMSIGFPMVEYKLIDLTIRMFTEPCLTLNKDLLLKHLHDVKDAKQSLMNKMLISKEELMSNPKLAEVLKSLNVIPPTKISATTGKETFAFAKSDEGFKALLEHPNVIVQAIVAARLGVKSILEETRTERFIGIADRGTIPIPLRYYAAHTGRWGGCLVGDTQVTVCNEANGVETKRIIDVLADDLVWDGEEFVLHDGVVFSGFSEVIEWDGVKGTEDHVVFTNIGEISLREAMQGKHKITVARSITQNDVDTVRKFISVNEAKN